MIQEPLVDLVQSVATTFLFLCHLFDILRLEDLLDTAEVLVRVLVVGYAGSFLDFQDLRFRVQLEFHRHH